MSDLQDRVIDVLRDVVDPEVGLDVVALGLVYGVEDRDGEIDVALTMTTPTCPLSEQIVDDAEQRVRKVPGVRSVTVRLVWDPPWTPQRMSEDARRALGWGM